MLIGIRTVTLAVRTKTLHGIGVEGGVRLLELLVTAVLVGDDALSCLLLILSGWGFVAYTV